MLRTLHFTAACLFAASLGSLSYLAAEDGRDFEGRNGIHRVLLISIDGMHALDYENCVKTGTCPNLAALGKHGVTYTRASTSKPSDSFPGLMALVTGASPKTHGAFYDVAYDRTLAPPQITTGNGVAGGPCSQIGTRTEYEEGDDFDQTKLNGGGPYGPTGGGYLSINPARLPRDPNKPDKTYGCAPVYPWNFIRANTIYGVVHAANGYTAWSDKHGAYAAVSGPTGTAIPSNVDDYYSPDVNSNQVSLPGIITAGTNFSCKGINPSSNDWTTDFQAIQCYDQLKVNAILNEIDGKTHDGLKAQVPNLFGMNFQAVSVGEKLIENGVKGGYTNAAGNPTAELLSEIKFVDAAIGQMTDELQEQHLLDSTLIIITAKHGQSPIDTNKFFEPSTTPATLLGAAGLLPDSEVNGIGSTEDDISLLWLNHGSDVPAAVAILEANAGPNKANPSAPPGAAIGEIFYGPSLGTMFNLPPPYGTDSRTPDIIVQPNVGVIYSGSSKKQEEHGGFAHDDTNVMLLVSNPNLDTVTVTSAVETTQVAPTILYYLGLDPNSLQGVQKEGTPLLPDIGL